MLKAANLDDLRYEVYVWCIKTGLGSGPLQRLIWKPK